VTVALLLACRLHTLEWATGGVSMACAVQDWCWLPSLRHAQVPMASPLPKPDFSGWKLGCSFAWFVQSHRAGPQNLTVPWTATQARR
jgi:hypothetical protein